MSNIDDILLGISESLKQLQKASQEKPIEQTQPVQIQNLEVNSTKNSQMIIIVKLPMIILNSPIKPNHLSRCQFFKSQLELKGFTYLPESKPWADLKAGKYFTTRNGSSLAAFVVGKDWQASKGVGAIGSYIDSLTTVLKPNSTKAKVDGYELLGVAPYAGTLGSVWWDRDLGIGGRLLVKDGKG